MRVKESVLLVGENVVREKTFFHEKGCSPTHPGDKQARVGAAALTKAVAAGAAAAITSATATLASWGRGGWGSAGAAGGSSAGAGGNIKGRCCRRVRAGIAPVR